MTRHSAIEQLHAALQSGHRPSPQRFRDAIQEIDWAIREIIEGLPPITRSFLWKLIEFRSVTVGMQNAFESGEEATNYVIDRMVDFLSADDPKPEEEDPNGLRICSHCQRKEAKLYAYVATGEDNAIAALCLRCAEELGVRPTGKI